MDKSKYFFVGGFFSIAVYATVICIKHATIGAGAITRWYPAMKSSAVCAKWAPKSVNSKQAI